MAAKIGRLPSSGSISVSQINTHAGRSATATTNLGDNHMRAFQGGRATNSETSLGNARGRAVTFGKYVKRAGVGNPSTLSTFSLSEYFHHTQMAAGYPLYITSEITDDWWGPINDPRNITITNIGTNRTVRHGGTGGRKNYYCDTTYYNSKSLYLRGFYSGKKTSNRNGRVNVGHLSLLDAGYGKLS
jgi:hypothetical protein